jgi:K+-sensing histidine kinase KdpD
MLTPDLALISFGPILDKVIQCCHDSYDEITIHTNELPMQVMQNKMYTDASWLFDNLLCLVTNAAKYTKDSCISIRISMMNKHQSQQDYLHFEVEDGGEYLSEKTMNNFFLLFGDKQDQVGGTGLGLYCLKRRIEALDGTCGILRRPHISGSVIWFEIPFIPEKSKLPSAASFVSESGRLLLPKSTSAHDLMKLWRKNSKIGIIATGTTN